MRIFCEGGIGLKYRFLYSKQQTMDDCNPLVETPDGFKEYSEMRSDGGSSDWDDAVLVYESNVCPKIDPHMCGNCMRCCGINDWMIDS
jgi:hypothetical protein